MKSISNLVKQDIQNQIPQFKLKTDRFYFKEDQGWYFHCRTGNQGPFETKAIAELSLANHIKEQKN